MFDYLTSWTLARELLVTGCFRLEAIRILLEPIPIRRGCFVACEENNKTQRNIKQHTKKKLEEQILTDAVEIFPNPPSRIKSPDDELPDFSKRRRTGRPGF